MRQTLISLSKYTIKSKNWVLHVVVVGNIYCCNQYLLYCCQYRLFIVKISFENFRSLPTTHLQEEYEEEDSGDDWVEGVYEINNNYVHIFTISSFPSLSQMITILRK